jgi:hypothetical protein
MEAENSSIEKIKKTILKSNIILSFLTAIVFLTTPLYTAFSQKYIDESLKDSVVTYAALRSLNAGISVIQESSLSFSLGIGGDIAIGQVLDPLNDAIERFSDLITLSIWVLGAQKALFEISKTDIIYIVVFIVVLFGLFFKHKLLNKFLVILIILRLFIPFSAVVSHYFNNQIFDPQIEKNLSIIQHSSKEPLKISSHKSDGFFSAINDSLNDTKDSVEKFMEYVNFYISNSSKIMSAIINLSSAYLAKYLLNLILLPLLFVYIVRNIAK